MLKKDLYTKIATIAKVDVAELEKALLSTEDEVNITIPEIQSFLTEELAQRDANAKKQGYNEGKTASMEMWVKETKEKHGLDFEGKDPSKLIEAIQSKTLAEAKIEPNKKVEELQTVVSKLQGNLTTFETEKATLLGQIEATKTDAKLLSLLPQNRLQHLNDEEYLTIIKKDYQIVTEDGKQVVKKNGEILRNATTQNPLEINEVIGGIFTERKWVAEDKGGQGGRGGQGSKGGTENVFLKVSEIEKKFKDEGKSTLGQEFQDFVISAKKENPSLDLNA